MDMVEKIKALLVSRATHTDALGFRLCSVNLRRFIGGPTCMDPPHFYGVDDDFYRLFPDEEDVLRFIDHPAVEWRNGDSVALISLGVLEKTLPSEIFKRRKLLHLELRKNLLIELNMEMDSASSDSAAKSIMCIVGPYFGEIYGKTPDDSS